MAKDSHVVPAVASAIIPGLGQLLKGHYFKAILFWAAVGILYFFYHKIFGWIFYPVAFLGWIVNILDAAYSNHKG